MPSPRPGLPPLELRHLSYFVAVAEELSFTRAAARLYIAQSPLSHAIRQLEAALEVTLFERTTRRVELTAAGEALLPRARAALAQIDEAVAAARHASPDHTTLALRLSLDMEHVVAPLVAALGACRPDIQVSAWQAGEAEELRDLLTGRVDAVFVWEGASVEADARVQSVAVVPSGIVVPAGHPLADLDVVPASRLLEETVVLFPREQAPGIYDLLVERLFGDRAGEAEIRAVAPVLSAQRTMARAVAAGLGVAPMTLPVFGLLPEGHGLVLRPLEPAVAFSIDLVWRAPPSPALAAFLEVVRRRAGRAATQTAPV